MIVDRAELFLQLFDQRIEFAAQRAIEGPGENLHGVAQLFALNAKSVQGQVIAEVGGGGRKEIFDQQAQRRFAAWPNVGRIKRSAFPRSRTRRHECRLAMGKVFVEQLAADLFDRLLGVRARRSTRLRSSL